MSSIIRVAPLNWRSLLPDAFSNSFSQLLTQDMASVVRMYLVIYPFRPVGLAVLKTLITLQLSVS